VVAEVVRILSGRTEVGAQSCAVISVFRRHRAESLMPGDLEQPAINNSGLRGRELMGDRGRRSLLINIHDMASRRPLICCLAASGMDGD